MCNAMSADMAADMAADIAEDRTADWATTYGVLDNFRNQIYIKLSSRVEIINLRSATTIDDSVIVYVE